MNYVLLTHYFPPINSAGAKRMEALSAYLANNGNRVTVVTTTKSASDGAFSEISPDSVSVIELAPLGRIRASQSRAGTHETMYAQSPSMSRRIKDVTMRIFGQLPDPRLPFAASMLNPLMPRALRTALREADIVIGTTPPWPMVLAALFIKYRFKVPVILDYRDHFSECHEMPGSWVAKRAEKIVDRWMSKHADYVVAISEPMAKYYLGMTPHVETIMNGYDHRAMMAAKKNTDAGDPSVITMRYTGIVSPGRIPHEFFRALVRLTKQSPQLAARIKIEYYGSAALIRETVSERYGTIQSNFSFFESVPYMTSLSKIASADYLLFCETSSRSTLSAQGILPTKLFEYIGSGRPVLANISPLTLAGSILMDIGAPHTVSDDENFIFEVISSASFYCRHPNVVSEAATQFSRDELNKKYMQLAERLVVSTNIRRKHA